MTRIKTLGMTVALAALALPTLVHAQQTRAGAQEFLRQVAAQGAMRLSTDTGDGWQRSVRPYDSHTFPPNTVTGVSGGDTCASTLAYQPHATVVYGSEARGNYSPHYDPIQNNLIDWSRVVEVLQSGTDIYLTGTAYPLKVGLGSEALATRVAYAMEFLRLECDPTASTGF